VLNNSENITKVGDDAFLGTKFDDDFQPWRQYYHEEDANDEKHIDYTIPYNEDDPYHGRDYLDHNHTDYLSQDTSFAMVPEKLTDNELSFLRGIKHTPQRYFVIPDSIDVDKLVRTDVTQSPDPPEFTENLTYFKVDPSALETLINCKYITKIGRGASRNTDLKEFSIPDGCFHYSKF
jgi:hypothetical protein